MRLFLMSLVFLSASLSGVSLFGESKPASHPQATIHTSQGDIVVVLFDDVAPKAVENFLKHAQDHYYDNTIFHRVIPGFMIQGGDPLGNGTGRPVHLGRAV